MVPCMWRVLPRVVVLARPCQTMMLTRGLATEPPAKDTKVPKIYTKTGDKGKSSLYTGERRRKDDAVFAALGAVDELSCQVELYLSWCRSSRVSQGHTFSQ